MSLSFHHFSRSSLRVRGILNLLQYSFLSDGVIPACAGNMDEPYLVFSSFKGHPCVCGEYRDIALIGCCNIGSSLRVRGILSAPLSSKNCIRVIPACAGNMVVGTITSMTCKGHPCVCGEYVFSHCYSPKTLGSSLRVRGIYTRTLRTSPPKRVIPACAGNIYC